MPDVKSLGIRSFKQKLLTYLILFLNTFCNLHQLRMFLMTSSSKSQSVRMLNQGLEGPG